MRASPMAVTLVAVWILGLAAPSRGEAAVVWIELAEPAVDAVQTGPVPLIVVRGFAGVRASGHDVVILVDVSRSSLDPAGFDVDGDGRVGRRLRSADDALRSYHPRRQCNDPGDTIRAAELRAVRSWAKTFEGAPRTRVALVTFDAAAHTAVGHGAGLGALDAATRELEQSLAAPAGSDLARGLDAAGALLEDREPGWHASVLLLSDGRAERPGLSHSGAARQAREAATRLRTQGIAIHALALGGSEAEVGLLGDLARETGGSSIAVANLADLELQLGQLELGPVAALEIRNRTAEVGGRAVRVHPDGGFDAVVPLAPGENHIVVRARDAAGAERTLERRVHFEPREARTAAEARAVAADLDALRARTLELEMAAAIERGRAQAHRRLLELEAASR